jgi:hypothetical protein
MEFCWNLQEALNHKGLRVEYGLMKMKMNSFFFISMVIISYCNPGRGALLRHYDCLFLCVGWFQPNISVCYYEIAPS